MKNDPPLDETARACRKCGSYGISGASRFFDFLAGG